MERLGEATRLLIQSKDNELLPKLVAEKEKQKDDFEFIEVRSKAGIEHYMYVYTTTELGSAESIDKGHVVPLR
jgi:hypothetical protein